MSPIVRPGPALRRPLLCAVAVVSLLGFATVLAWSGRKPRLPKVRTVEACELVRIPGGSFSMGSPLVESQRGSDETPHRVRLSAFLLGKCEVTQAEWQAVMGANPSSFRGDPRLPVEGVTWYDCLAFCNRLSAKSSFRPCYAYAGVGTDPERWPAGWKQSLHDRISCDWSADGYRLPTEAEWEYACKAGTVTATAFGEAITSRQANFNGEEPLIHGQGPNLRRTTPVGSYPPNAWGLFDLHGNVSEWCWDWYASYDPAASADPRGPAMPQRLRVFRGGSWFNYGSDQRSAARFSDTPYFRLDMLPGGLRLARTSP